MKVKKTKIKKSVHPADCISQEELANEYKTVCDNIKFSTAINEYKIIVVSGTEDGVGKTLTAANIAISLGKQSKILLIDADMRKPGQHNLFNVQNTVGLSNIICDIDKDGEKLHTGAAKNVDLITSGTVPPNPFELLASEKMENILEDAMGKYDYIVIDTPAINDMVTDALALMTDKTGVVIVCQQDRTTIEDLNEINHTIKLTGANFIGVVLNRSNKNKKHLFLD